MCKIELWRKFLQKLLLDLTLLEPRLKNLLLTFFPVGKQIEIYQETLQSRTVCGSRLRKNYRCDIFPKKERNYNDERTNGVSSSACLAALDFYSLLIEQWVKIKFESAL